MYLHQQVAVVPIVHFDLHQLLHPRPIDSTEQAALLVGHMIPRSRHTHLLRWLKYIFWK